MGAGRKWMLAGAGTLATLAISVGFVGLLHTSVGRPLLLSMGGCPVGKASPADIEQGRLAAARETRGSESAPSRPALGFKLDQTTGADIRSWAARSSIACDEKREGTLFVCRDVAAASLASATSGPAVDVLYLQLREAAGTLVNVSAYRSKLSPSDAASQIDALSQHLKTQLGPPAGEAGERSASYLASGGFATATLSYRFTDYMADATAMNLDGVVSLREHYMSATEASAVTASR